MTFQLDTTGLVMVRAEGLAPNHPHAGSNISWADLPSFTQGYVEALFAGLRHEFEDGTVVEGHLSRFRDGSTYWYPVAFSDLAPETLARIIADCEKFVTLYKFETTEDGRTFWKERQAAPGRDATLFREAFGAVFPPLTVQLCDDGKVRFSQAEGAA